MPVDVTISDIESLAAKLAALDLTAAERAALDSIFAADGPETTGFEFEEIKVTVVARPEPSGYTKVEWTYIRPFLRTPG